MRENPDTPINVDLSKDPQAYATWTKLINRMARGSIEAKRRLADQTKIDDVREQMGLSKQADTELILDTVPLAENIAAKEVAAVDVPETQENRMQEYLKLPNVQEARKKILGLLEHVREKEGGAWDKYKLGNLQAQIYEMLSTRSQFPKLLAEAGGDAATLQQRFQEQDTRYRAIMKQMEEVVKHSGFDFVKGAWSGINTRPEVGAREELNYKSYTTI